MCTKGQASKVGEGGYKHQLLPGCQTSLRIWVKVSKESEDEREESTCALKVHAKRKAKVESKLSYKCASKSLSILWRVIKVLEKVARGDACPRN